MSIRTNGSLPRFDIHELDICIAFRVTSAIAPNCYFLYTSKSLKKLNELILSDRVVNILNTDRAKIAFQGVRIGGGSISDQRIFFLCIDNITNFITLRDKVRRRVRK
jgi:hypothetical protein